jgi:hypothetical protein
MSCVINASNLQLGGTEMMSLGDGVKIPPTQVKIYYPSLTTSGTSLSGSFFNSVKYISYGSFKQLWGNVSLTWSTSSVNKTGSNVSFTLPSGFFTNVQCVFFQLQHSFGSQITYAVTGQGSSQSVVYFKIFNSTGQNVTSGDVLNLAFLVIGT